MKAADPATANVHVRRAPGGTVLPGTVSWERFFWIGVTAFALLVHLSPAVQSMLEFDRGHIAAGQTWRLLTGNFVHYSWAHLAANLGAFAALCWIAEGRSRGLSWVVALSSPAVGLAVFGLADGVATYRGVSGVDCALLAWILTTMAIQDGRRKAMAWIGVLALVSAKSVIEALTGQVLLPTSAPAGVAVVGATHVVGLAIGAAAGLAGKRLEKRPRPGGAAGSGQTCSSAAMRSS